MSETSELCTQRPEINDDQGSTQLQPDLGGNNRLTNRRNRQWSFHQKLKADPLSNEINIKVTKSMRMPPKISESTESDKSHPTLTESHSSASGQTQTSGQDDDMLQVQQPSLEDRRGSTGSGIVRRHTTVACKNTTEYKQLRQQKQQQQQNNGKPAPMRTLVSEELLDVSELADSGPSAFNNNNNNGSKTKSNEQSPQPADRSRRQSLFDPIKCELTDIAHKAIGSTPSLNGGGARSSLSKTSNELISEFGRDSWRRITTGIDKMKAPLTPRLSSKSRGSNQSSDLPPLSPYADIQVVIGTEPNVSSMAHTNTPVPIRAEAPVTKYTILVVGSAKCGKTALIAGLRTLNDHKALQDSELRYVECDNHKDASWHNKPSIALYVVVMTPSNAMSRENALSCVMLLQGKNAVHHNVPVLLVMLSGTINDARSADVKKARLSAKRTHVKTAEVCLEITDSIRQLNKRIIWELFPDGGVNEDEEQCSPRRPSKMLKSRYMPMCLRKQTSRSCENINV